MSDLVGNPEGRFSQNEAQLATSMEKRSQCCTPYALVFQSGGATGQRPTDRLLFSFPRLLQHPGETSQPIHTELRGSGDHLHLPVVPVQVSMAISCQGYTVGLWVRLNLKNLVGCLLTDPPFCTFLVKFFCLFIFYMYFFPLSITVLPKNNVFFQGREQKKIIFLLTLPKSFGSINFKFIFIPL